MQCVASKHRQYPTMLRPTHKLLFAAVTLTGCFAAQALFVDTQNTASAAQIEQLTSRLALCPELSPSVATALDQHHGFLPATISDELTDQIRQCERQRRHLPNNARTHMAYTALAALAHSQSGTRYTGGDATHPEHTPLRLKLSQQLQQ